MFAGLVMLPAFIVFGGFVLLGLTVWRRVKQAEFRHRERMAMIERGMTPPDQVLGDAALKKAHGFKLTLGIMLCGFGLALVMLISFAAREPSTAFGVGGAFVMVGLAFVVAALAMKREQDATPPAPPPISGTGL
jgi:hypothetical protein